MIQIVPAASAAEIETVATLFREYAASLDIDLSFQGFAEELAGLPGDYAPPRGALLLALDDGRPVGCVAIRPLEWPEIAELKRLYVRPEGRGRAIGLQLTRAALAAASEIGYRRVRLDTLPTMVAARRLYESIGFREIEAYRFNPIPGAHYMELALDDPGI